MAERAAGGPFDRTVLEDITAFRQARSPVLGWLTVWSGAQRGADFPLRAGRNFIGSQRECQVRLNDPQVPDFWLNIRIGQAGWTLIDLDSDGGFWRNDHPSFRGELEDGDWIRAGELLLRVKMRA